jgi:hypothetical protein
VRSLRSHLIASLPVQLSSFGASFEEQVFYERSNPEPEEENDENGNQFHPPAHSFHHVHHILHYAITPDLLRMRLIQRSADRADNDRDQREGDR